MNIWTKKYNKSNKSAYELSKELNIPEDKIKEVIRGEREVPTNDVDRVNGAFSSNTIGISSFERAMMEQFFIDNDIQDLKKKFKYGSLKELSNAMNLGVSTMYYLRGDKIKAMSDKLLKKAYDFFQDNWNINSVKPKTKPQFDDKEFKKNYYYSLPEEKLSKGVMEWYENTDIRELREQRGIKVKELLYKLGFGSGYYSVLCKVELKHKYPSSNYLIIQQLYNFYHGLELLNTKATTEKELYNNINTPIYEYEKPTTEDIELLDIEPTIEVQEQRNEENENSIFNGLTTSQGYISTTIDEPIDTTSFVAIEEYNKVCEELERYKFLIDMLMKQER